MKRLSSKKQIILIMMFFLIPLLGLLIGYNLYNINALNQGLAESRQNTILLYSNAFERELKDIENYTASFLANDADSIQMRYQNSILQSHVLTMGILQKYRTMMNAKNVMAAFFLYAGNNTVFRRAYRYEYSYLEKTETEAFVRQVLREDPDVIKRGWFFHQIEGRPFLFRFLGSRSLYNICVVDLDYVDTPQELKKGAGEELLFFLDQQGKPVTEQSVLEAAQMEPGLSQEAFSIVGQGPKKYFLVQTYFPAYDLTIAHASPYVGILMNMNAVQITFFVGSAMILLLICFSFYFLKRFFLKPFDSLVTTMEQIRNGRWDAKLETAGPVDEFVRLQNTFNAMIEEIRSLKIASYEQRLERQQVELQYLQLQIRPHFFLNCLKNLYALVQGRQYEQTQEFILKLSEHLRYLFREMRTLVQMETEIKNVENYISLQRMVMPVPPVFTVEIDDRLNKVFIPPLSLLTFIENSVKYGSPPGKALELHTKIVLLQDSEESYVSITIRDNGGGFPEEILRVLQTDLGEMGTHLGIQNVYRRFRLLYGEKCVFFFSNRCGAEIEIYFPYDPNGENGRELLCEC